MQERRSRKVCSSPASPPRSHRHVLREDLSRGSLLEALLTLWVPFHAALILSTVVLSVLAATASWQHHFHLSLVPHLTRDHQLYRLIAHHVAYANSSELLIGTLLLWQTCPGLERLFGTRKFAVSGLFPFSFFWRVHALTPFLAEFPRDDSGHVDGSRPGRPRLGMADLRRPVQHASVRPLRSRAGALVRPRTHPSARDPPITDDALHLALATSHIDWSRPCTTSASSTLS